MTGIGAHHLDVDEAVVAGNGGRGRVFLLPGSPARAERIAARLDGAEARDNPRRLTVWTGRFGGVDVGVVPTGMGCPSLGIVVTELIGLGVRRLVRVGSAGSLQPGRVRVGDLVIARAAVRDEGSSDAFAPREVPAVAHPDWVRALERAAAALGVADRTFTGVVHTKDTLYGREFPSGPLAGANRRYMEVLAHLGVLASEMESSHLFVLAAWRGPDVRPISRPEACAEVVKAGSVLAIIGDEGGWAGPEVARATEDLAIEAALRAAADLVAAEEAEAGG